MANDKGWFVKSNRSEEDLGNPFLYYTDDEVEKYARSGGMKKAQERIAYRILELLNIKKSAKILDIGSGPGYTASVYKENGYDVTCLDLIPKMVEKAKANGFKAIIGDMRNLKEIFPTQKFDAVLSASALQWIKYIDDIKKTAQGIYSILKQNSQAIIQFYPKTEQELNDIAKVFKKAGFSTQIITDNPDVPKNRTCYLLMRRE